MTQENLSDKQIAELEEILEMAKIAEQKAREMCELSTAIAWKYQKRMQKIREFVLSQPFPRQSYTIIYKHLQVDDV